jgi:hypothetical protein
MFHLERTKEEDAAVAMTAVPLRPRTRRRISKSRVN